jgi:hypothetical protein
VKPKDFLEEMWVRDVADLTWEILRMRRLKAALVASAMTRGLESILGPLIGWSKASDLSKNWALGNRRAVEEVKKHLSQMG